MNGRQNLPCSPAPDKHVENIRKYIGAGFDEIYVRRICPEQEGFFRFFEEEIRPQL